jgi:hypothetical protein
MNIQDPRPMFTVELFCITALAALYARVAARTRNFKRKRWVFQNIATFPSHECPDPPHKNLSKPRSGTSHSGSCVAIAAPRPMYLANQSYLDPITVVLLANETQRQQLGRV